MTGYPTAWTEGLELPALTLPPLDRVTLALYAGASNDHNPLHLDPAFAREAGLPDVIGQGMLTMALLGRYLTGLAPQSQVRRFSVRFLSMAQLGDAIRCEARVSAVTTDPHETGGLATLELIASRPGGEILARGEAAVRLAP